MPKRTNIKKRLSALSAWLLCAGFASAKGAVVTATTPQPSPGKVQIAVGADGKLSQHAAAVVDLIANGRETLVSLFTADHAVAKWPPLKPGNDPIVQGCAPAFGSDFQLLDVRDDAGGQTTARRLPRPPAFSSPADRASRTAEKRAASERIEAFKGIVEDVTRAGVPGALVEIFPRNSADSRKIVGFKTDGRGHFSAPLASGAYTAFLRAPGSRGWLFVFEIARNGEANELRA